METALGICTGVAAGALYALYYRPMKNELTALEGARVFYDFQELTKYVSKSGKVEYVAFEAVVKALPGQSEKVSDGNSAVWVKRTEECVYAHNKVVTTTTVESKRAVVFKFPFLLRSVLGTHPKAELEIEVPDIAQSNEFATELLTKVDFPKYTFPEVKQRLAVEGRILQEQRVYERVLMDNTRLTVIGHVSKKGSFMFPRLVLEKQEGHPMILSKQPKSSIVAQYRSKADTVYFLCVGLGIVAGCVVGYKLVMWGFAEYRKQIAARQLRYYNDRRSAKLGGKKRREEVDEEGEEREGDEDVVRNAQGGDPNRPGSANTDCVICLAKRADAVMLDCGHMFTCVECGQQLVRCPICRSRIRRLQRVFANY